MADYTKDVNVAFEEILGGFNDAMVFSHTVNVHKTSAQAMERANDIVWRPMPYISKSYDGQDQTGNFHAYTQLSVPASIGFHKSVPWEMSVTELRDQLQENRLGESARQKLGSDVNTAVRSVASMQGTIVVKRDSEASGYDDIAEPEASMDELGIQSDSRIIAIASRDYNSMAANLAARQTMNKMPTEAYRKSNIGPIAGFETFKLDTATRLSAATAVDATIDGASQYYTPKAQSQAVTGETANVDNRSQDIITAVVSGSVQVGDCLTIDGVNSVHHITKESTGRLKTFRVTGVGVGSISISPPIISAEGGTLAEQVYQNVDATPANGAGINFLNTVTAYANPFWIKDSIELLPGTYPVPDKAGVGVRRGTTDQGIELVMQEYVDINTGLIKFRFDTRFGVANTCPEMNGIVIFNQV